ncbi:hypothetical protein ACPC54_09865 [Kitasatospora sp. NPDC094028]
MAENRPGGDKTPPGDQMVFIILAALTVIVLVVVVGAALSGGLNPFEDAPPGQHGI